MRSRTVRLWTLSALLALPLFACGDDGGSELDPVLDEVSVSPVDPELEAIGATVQLNAAVTNDQGGPVTGAQLTWSSSEESVATVSGSGLVTAVGNGQAIIEVEASDGTAQASATTTVTVQQRAAAVTLTAPEEVLSVGQNMQLEAAAEDANGNAIEDADIAFGSTEETVATVTAEGVVSAVGPGETVLSATLDGEEATADLTVVVGDVVFDEDTEISGTLQALSLTIAAGATVTATGDVTIEAGGDVDIQGSLVGDCVEMVLDGEGDLSLSGTIDNHCTSGGAGPGVTLVNAGTIDVAGGTITASGPVTIANDGVVGGAPGLGAYAEQTEDRTCTFESLRIEYNPTKLPAGNPGLPGDDIGLKCVNTATFVGGNVINAQSGGDGVADEAGNPTAVGADAGAGGGVRLEVLEGDMIFQDATLNGAQGTAVSAGDGGAGGNALALGSDAEPNAVATGGNGAAGGPVSIQALNGDIVIEGLGGLRVHVGDGGAGGEAEAQGRDGEDPGEHGGAAEATGGDGGDSGEWSMTSIEGGASSAVITGREDIIQDGGNGGRGGNAISIGGNGAAGDPDGGNGGAMTSSGGFGGDAIEALPAILGIGDGGDGGDAWWEQGRGGAGADRCWDEPGGNGGNGGDGLGVGFGLGGSGGDGGADGTDNVAAGTGDGGPGGAGVGPGAGGAGGSNGTTDDGDDAWRDGAPGEHCSAELGVGLTVDPDDESGHEPFIMMAATVTMLEVTLLEGGSILVEGNGNWIDVSGSVDESGNFVATGIGSTANGSTGVAVRFEGILELDENGVPVGVVGVYSVGTNGVLPGGMPIHYDVTAGG